MTGPSMAAMRSAASPSIDEDDDAVKDELVAVVEDDVAARGVVPEVADAGWAPAG